ncbi:MAG: polysaccharide deacetylase family protein [Parvibaculum sp.]
MAANPILRKLGLSDQDRAVVLHADDIGMCQATVSAFDALWKAKAISCGAAMVPCSWFNAAATLCRQDKSIDMGVHATLTSEWNAYRWGPLSATPGADGLVDAEMRFHKTSKAVAQNAVPAAAKAELKQQIALARASGIEPTHIDTHMGSVMTGPLYEVFVELAREEKVPPFALRLSAADWQAFGLDDESAEALGRRAAELEADGFPVYDSLLNVRLSDEEDRTEKSKSVLSALQPGQVGYFILHPAHDTPELRALCPDWRSRVADLDMFLSGEMTEFLSQKNITIVGTRELNPLIL